MQQELKITIIQSELIWEDPDANRKNFDKKIEEVPADADLIILPEMFTTGFTMQVKNVAETMQGKSIKWMLKKASENNAVLMGSVIIEEQKKYFNRYIVAFPSGEIKYYDKKHLFTMAGENRVFTAGSEKLLFTYKSFRICPLICYDLRFPVWARNSDNFDLLIYVANWPKTRINAWDTLLKARAIENLCYSIGVNRVGTDKNNLIYNGHSVVNNALGETLLQFKESQELTKSIILFKEHINETRRKLSFLDDRDNFEII